MIARAQPGDPRRPEADLWLARALPGAGWLASNEVTKPHGCVLFALDAGGAVIGALIAWIVVDEAHLLAVGVDTARRRGGAGGALVHALGAHARERGCTKMLLEVSAANTAALALYRRVGFEVVNTRAGYYADGSDGVEMCWTW